MLFHHVDFFCEWIHPPASILLFIVLGTSQSMDPSVVGPQQYQLIESTPNTAINYVCTSNIYFHTNTKDIDTTFSRNFKNMSKKIFQRSLLKMTQFWVGMANRKRYIDQLIYRRVYIDMSDISIYLIFRKKYINRIFFPK